MKTNARAANTARTHEGGSALPAENSYSELRRAVLSCLLFENTFYEKGSDIAERIDQLSRQCPPEKVSALAIEARHVHGLRHVSLFLALSLLGRSGAAETITQVIARPDELAEVVAIYWRAGRKPLAAALKRGVANAFAKFDAERLAKYDRDDKVKLRDVLFLTHPKPVDDAQAEAFKALASRTLATPDTWEVALSAGQDKKATWERLISENKLGALALLRNLRNMDAVGVPHDTIRLALAQCKPWGVLPWQIVGAAVHAPWAEPELEALMFRSLADRKKLPGRTLLVIDVSGSMGNQLSARGERTRLDAACALAMVAREACESCDLWSFSNQLAVVPPRRGFGLSDAIRASQPMSGTYLGAALKLLIEHGPKSGRIVVVTDEQVHDNLPPVPYEPCYIVNVAPYKPAVQTSGAWTRIDGWSDRLLDWIETVEGEQT